MIFCDIGNSTFSFLLANKIFNVPLCEPLPTKDELINLTNNNLDAKEQIMDNDKLIIYYISVNKIAQKNFKEFYKNFKNSTKIINLKTLINGLFTKKIKQPNSVYDNIGIDRKAICLNIKNAIVIDAGSAITIDIVKNNNYLGGYILPGLKSYNNAYKKINKVLDTPFLYKQYNLDKIQFNTKNCINVSIIKSVISLINEIFTIYNLDIIVAGGDGSYLKNYLKNAQLNTNLLLYSMKKTLLDNKV